ncbi:MAG: hypothetical protein JSS87_08135 [Acidobacteria bacterium]|nr:hypothetical protein [Acidobacteriota bacterium]
MTSLSFPDVNVWVALSWPGHMHHRKAWQWYASQPATTSLVFCRVTQLGFLRLLTTAAVMGADLLTNEQAYDSYAYWIRKDAAFMMDEPTTFENTFRTLSPRKQSMPKAWSDDYVQAFATEARIPLVTFNQALAKRTPHSILL